MLDIPHSLKIGTSSQRNLLQNQTDPRAFGRANVLCGEHPPGPDHPGFLEKTAHYQEASVGQIPEHVWFRSHQKTIQIRDSF
jgi:hypothetical protein